MEHSRKLINLNPEQGADLATLKDVLEKEVIGINWSGANVVAHAIAITRMFYRTRDIVRKGGRAYFNEHGGLIVERPEIVKKRKQGEQ